MWGYEQSTNKTAKARWKLAYISALDGLVVFCDSRTSRRSEAESRWLGERPVRDDVDGKSKIIRYM